MTTPLLEIDKLTVRFGASTVVDEVSFSIAAGEKFGLVGESGSGKSVTALSVLRLVDAAQSSGRIVFDGADLMQMSERAMRGIRGARIACIFFSGRVVSSVSPKRMEPPVTRTAGAGNSPMQASDVIDLPEPLSPAIASVSPR